VSGENGEVIALAGHPRATASIERLRSLAALGAAAFVAFLSHTSGLPLFDCLLRALTAGIVGYFVGWFVGVTVWRQLIRAQIRAALAQRVNATTAGEQ
jgi:uncharacterized membrane protein YccC